MSSRNATREDFEHVIGSLKNGLVNHNTYIAHRASIDEVISQFDGWLNPAAGIIKVMIEV